MDPSERQAGHSAPEDSQRILVGCYTDASGEGGIRRVGLSAGGLALDQPAARAVNASWLEEHKALVLGVSERSESALLAVDTSGTVPVVVRTWPSGGRDACHLAVSPDGRTVAVAHYGSGDVAFFRLGVDGLPWGPVGRIVFTGSGPDAERQESSHAHQCTWLTHQVLVVCDLGSDRLQVLDATDPCEPRLLTSVNLPPGTGPRHLVARPIGLDEWQLAVAGELDGRVTVVRHEGQDWNHGWWVGASVPGTRSPGSSQPSGLCLFGQDLVLADRGTDTITLLRWSEDGSLARISESPCGGQHPRDLAEHGGLLFVANQHSDEVTVLAHSGEGFEVVSRLPVPAPARLFFLGARNARTLGAAR